MEFHFCHKLKIRSCNARAVVPRTPSRTGRAACPHAILSVLVCLSLNSFAAGYDVAAYVWPAYQPEPRWAELGIFKAGKGEWQSVWEARPKWEGHEQPRRPLWGYEDESDPVVVARKIDAATAAGVNVFIYDWYWYGGRPFLENALDKGFLGAANCERMKFYIMYANHDVTKLWNNKVGDREKKEVIWSAKVTEDGFRQIADRWIAKYFTRQNYYRIRGCPVLMIYNIDNFISWDGPEAARRRLAWLRGRVKAAGFPGLHLQRLGSAWDDKPDELGFDSMTPYNWTSMAGERLWQKDKPPLTYAEWGDLALGNFDRVKSKAEKTGAVFFPNLTCGWDTNPRYPADCKPETVRNANPREFERFARRVKAWADANLPADLPRLVTVNSWNEWTEGSYLEPDDRFGYGYLNALWRVFVVEP